MSKVFADLSAGAEPVTAFTELAQIAAELNAGPNDWYSGAGVPAAGLGVNGDFYLDTATKIPYTKVAGAWV